MEAKMKKLSKKKKNNLPLFLFLIISFIILQAFGMTIEQSLQLQLTFFVVSYIRSYLVRRTFERINEKRKAEL